MEPSFEKLLVRLAEGEVRFVVVGGVAVTIQGYVRMTEDVDLLIDPDENNVRRLLEILSGFGEGFARELSVSDFTDEEGAIRIVEETEYLQVDLFTRMSGRRYGDVTQDVAWYEIGGNKIAVASKASLIGWKEDSSREKDRLDARALRELIEDPKSFD
ncbi:MAG: nucleotidyltransferase [Chthoniobacterales bacterium]